MASVFNIIYVIMEYGWEYNDEINYVSEGGRANTAYRDKEKADQVCKDMNLDKIKQEVLAEYCNDINDLIVDHILLNNILNHLNVRAENLELWEDTINNLETTPIIKNDIAACFGNMFYHVVEVPLELGIPIRESLEDTIDNSEERFKNIG